MPHLIQGIALGNYSYEGGGSNPIPTEVVQASSGFFFRERAGWNGDTTTLYAGYGPSGTIAVVADRVVEANLQDQQASCLTDTFGYYDFVLSDNDRAVWVPIASLSEALDPTDLLIHCAWQVSSQDYSYAFAIISDGTTFASNPSAMEWYYAGLNRRNPTGTPGLWIIDHTKLGVNQFSEQVSYGAVEMYGKVHQTRFVITDDGAGGLDLALYAVNLGAAICSASGNAMTPYEVDGTLAGTQIVTDVDMDGTAKVTHDSAVKFTPTHIGVGTIQKNPAIGNFFICGRNITVNGLPTGWKAGIDGHALVAETSGTVAFNCDTWYLPATTLTIYDGDEVEQFNITPTPPGSAYGVSEGGGIYGGDVYTCQ